MSFLCPISHALLPYGTSAETLCLISNAGAILQNKIFVIAPDFLTRARFNEVIKTNKVYKIIQLER